MATIWTSIRLRDGMTSPLNSMGKALGNVTSAFQKLQKASANGLNSKAVQSATKDLIKAQDHLIKTQGQMVAIRNKINQNTNAQKKFNNTMGNGVRIASSLGNAIRVGLGAYLGFQGIGTVVKTADELTMTTARLNLMNDGLQTTEQLSNQIYESAMRSRSGYLQTADAVAKLRLRAGQIFKTNEEAIVFSETLNKMFAIAGASGSEMYSATLQLTQALGSGVLRGEEFRAVFEAAPNVMQAVADHMNLPIGKLREIANEGQITADIVKNALFEATSKVDEQFKSIPKTWSQVWTMVKNYTIKTTEPILKRIRDITSSERFVGFMNGVGNAISIVAKHLEFVVFLVSELAAVIYDNWSVIESILIAIAIVYLPKIINGLWAMVQPILVSAAAWLVANWYILLIVAALAVVIWACKWAGVTFSDVCGTIAGIVTWLGAIIVNIAKFCYNAVAVFLGLIGIGVWNLILFIINKVSGCFQFITNAADWLADNFNTIFYNIGVRWDNLWIDATVGFLNFIDTVLAKLSALAQQIQPLAELLDIDLSGMIGKARGTITGKIVEAEAGRRQAKSYTAMDKANWNTYEYTPLSAIENSLLDYTDLSDSYNKGFNWGSKIGDKISDKTSDLISKYTVGGLGGINGLNDLGKAFGGGFDTDNPLLDKIANNTGDIANNTSSLASSKEDLSYMRDLAEREAINRYTLTDLKVEQNNNNNFANGVDAQGMLDLLKKILHDGVTASANGVHV